MRLLKNTLENDMDKLSEARIEINEIDREMAKLFERRMRAAEKVAEYKKENGLPILDAEREKAVIRNNSSLVEDEALKEYYTGFIKSTMEISRAYQSRLLEGMRVAYSGTEGAFAHLASRRLFPTAKHIAYPDFASAYRAAECGECDVAVLPIENSNNGEVGEVTDLMMSGTLFVNDVTEMAIDQDLLGIAGASTESVKIVVSHPQALGQCREYIRRKGYEEREYSNTALAARMVAEAGDSAIAAIGSAEAAELFGLTVLERKINSERTNTTRFAVFARALANITGGAMGVHSILTFTVKNEAGSLAKAIDIIGKHGFNMSALRSRPMKGLLWQYYFYVELEGNIGSAEGKEMLGELGELCDKLKTVGVYRGRSQG